jgi:hypothetical protein
MFKNKLRIFLFSLALSFTLFVPTVVSFVSLDKQEIASIIDFSSEEEEQKSEIENLEFKITFENSTNLFLCTSAVKNTSIFYAQEYTSIDKELHLPPPEQV